MFSLEKRFTEGFLDYTQKRGKKRSFARASNARAPAVSRALVVFHPAARGMPKGRGGKAGQNGGSVRKGGGEGLFQHVWERRGGAPQKKEHAVPLPPTSRARQSVRGVGGEGGVGRGREGCTPGKQRRRERLKGGGASRMVNKKEAGGEPTTTTTTFLQPALFIRRGTNETKTTNIKTTRINDNFFLPSHPAIATCGATAGGAAVTGTHTSCRRSAAGVMGPS